MSNAKKENFVLISMELYGFDIAIKTSIEDLETARLAVNDPRNIAYLTKSEQAQLYKKLIRSLQKMYAHYKSKPERMNDRYEAWSDFCSDCIILTILGSSHLGKPIAIMKSESIDNKNLVSNSRPNSPEDLGILSSDETINALTTLGHDVSNV